MGFIQDKQSLINEIGIFKTIGDLPETKSSSSFGSVKSESKNVLPYLLELLTTSCEDKKEEKQTKFNPTFTSQPAKGALLKPNQGDQNKCGTQKIITEILTDFLPELSRNIKESVINSIKESLSCSSDFNIPPNTSTAIDIETIDYNNLLKSNLENEPGFGVNLPLFGSTNRDFNLFLFNLLDTPNVVGTWDGPNGSLLDVTYVEPSQYVFSVNQNYWDTSYNRFISDYLSSIDLFDKKILLNSIIDHFFSNITTETGDSLDQLTKREMSDKMMEKILDTDPCYDDIIYDDTFFKFSNDEMSLFEARAKERYDGIVNIDLGCGIFPFDSKTVSGDFSVGSFDGLSSSEQENVIKNTINNIGDFASDSSVKNKESIKNKLNTDFILELPKVLMNTSVLTPKVLGIYSFSNYIINNVTVTESNSFDFIKTNRSFFEVILRASLAFLIKIVFNKLKRELLKLINKVINKILKSIINKKIKIITSYSLSIISGSISGLIDQIPSPQPQGL